MSYTGVYRGIVLDNNDPEHLCRVRVWVPLVHGQKKAKTYYPWAEACIPMGGDVYETERTNEETSEIEKVQVGYGCIFLPPVGSMVWVMFEEGELIRPIWFGCTYSKSYKKSPETPEEALSLDGFSYPNVYLIKPPVYRSPYIAFLGKKSNSQSKIVVQLTDGMRISLDEFDSGSRSIRIHLDDQGNLIDLSKNSEGEIRITLQCDGAMRVVGKKVSIMGTEKVTLSAPEVRCYADRVSGFEKRR